MKITRKIHVPTGEIYTGQSKDGRPIEFLTVADYGKNANIKADFLGITRELNGVPNGTPMPLSEKWVVTISTQHGCSMGCKFCDVPKVGPGVNICLDDLRAQVVYAITQHTEVNHTKRLNVHYARMGEPTFNRDVLYHASNYLREDVRMFLVADTVHPVVSTMLPKNNKELYRFLRDWCDLVKNETYQGEAGLQFSINSTDDIQRDWMFSGNTLSLSEISDIADKLPMPEGRKYALNFALADNSIIDGKKLASLFYPGKFMCKITPLHKTTSATSNRITTTGGYESFVPYRAAEADLKENGFDVIVFVPSQDEENGMITCGNAVLSGRQPSAATSGNPAE